MEFQIYEILLLFAVYSILGWAAAVCLFAKREGIYDNRGVCRGPWLPAFGLGGLFAVYASEPAAAFIQEWTGIDANLLPAGAFVCGAAAWVVFGLPAKALVNGLCGKKLIRMRDGDLLWAGAASAVAVCGLQPVITVLMRWISPWIHMVLLLLFYMQFLSELVDGLDSLESYKKKRTFPVRNE